MLGVREKNDETELVGLKAENDPFQDVYPFLPGGKSRIPGFSRRSPLHCGGDSAEKAVKFAWSLFSEGDSAENPLKSAQSPYA